MLFQEFLNYFLRLYFLIYRVLQINISINPFFKNVREILLVEV